MTKARRSVDATNVIPFSPSRFMPPSPRAFGAGMVILGLLGAAVVWRSPLIHRPLREDMAPSIAQPVASVSPHPARREPPLFPQHPALHEPSKRLQWQQTLVSHQLPTGQLLMVPLPQLQHTPEDAPVTVTLDASDSLPIWLKFDPEKLALSLIAPPTEAGKTYHLTFRAQTTHGLASLLELTVTLLAPTGAPLHRPTSGS